MNVAGLAVEVRLAVLRLGLVPDHRDLAGIAGGDPGPEHARAGLRDRPRRRPRLAEVLRVDQLDRVRRRRLGTVAAAARAGLAVVGVPGQVDRAARVDRDRRPVGVHRRSPHALVGREARAAVRHRADAEAEAPVRMLEDRGLDDGRLQLVVVQLPVGRKRAPVRKRPAVVDSGCATGVAAVVGDKYLMAAAAPLDRVGPHEDLVRVTTGEPRPVAVVAIGIPLVPVLASVDRREQRIVDEVDTRVVDASARVPGQIGIAEAGVFSRARRTRTPEVAVSEPVDAAVGRRPDVDLVAVVGDEAEVTPWRADDPVAVEMGRPLVRGVDQRSVLRVREDFRLAAGEILVDVDGRREGRSRRNG